MLTADKFKRVGYTKEEAERIDRQLFLTGRMHGDESARIRLHSSHCA